MKAFVAVNFLALVVGACIGLNAKEPQRFPPRILFPGELQKVRNTFSIESVKEARSRSARQAEVPAPINMRPVPIPPPEFDPIPEEKFEPTYRNPVELLGIEPVDEDEANDGGDAPVFFPPPESGRPTRPLTDEDWRHSADQRPAFQSEPAKR